MGKVSMLDKIINYVKFIRLKVKVSVSSLNYKIATEVAG